MATEAELLEQARAGDRQALNQLVGLYWQSLYRFVFYRVRHKEETEELTQETLLKVITYLPKFEERGIPLRSFVLRVASNLITDHWRKKARSGNSLPLAEAVVMSDCDSLDELVILEERKSMLDAAIKLLPEDQRQVILLRLVDGRSIKEAAALMQKSEGALKMLQQRALQNIRKHITKQL